jgi:formylglycine-generating enzyme required for sulfatase activity
MLIIWVTEFQRYSRRTWAALLSGLLLLTGQAAFADSEVARAGEHGHVRPHPSKNLRHFRDCDVCSEMIVLPSGNYMMGATEEEFRGQDNKYQFMYGIETPRHAVRVKSFALARFHVTRQQFSIFAKETGFSGKGCRTMRRQNGEWWFDPDADWQNPGFPQTDNDPVVCVSWNDAQQYIAWLNGKLAGASAHQYRLPTEEEWEYAARAGTATPMYWGNGRQEQCKYENARDKSASVLDPDAPIAPCDDKNIWTSPSGFFQPNPWGLYDMLGNASQWVGDCWAMGYAEHLDLFLPPNGICRDRVQRGASWASIPIAVRAANRNGRPPGFRDSTSGFRLAVGL